MVFIESTGLDIGIELPGGIFAPIIKRGTHLPARVSKVFKNSKNLQKIMLFKFYEGTRPTIENNTYLGQLRFEYPKRITKVNTAQVILFLTLDADGILSASAKYKKEESVQIVIDYGGVKCDDECASAMLDTAKQFEQLDQCERNRRRALSRLESALELMKHIVAYSRKYIYTADQVQEKRKACEECEKWIMQNLKASLQQYEDQLRKFHKSSDFFDDEWRANNRVQRRYCCPVKTKKRKIFGSGNKNGMYDTSGSSDEFSENDLMGDE
uniref:Uncharacterized protein n=1 Tax=Ditylenchus dipsaci TaxID=166011 RepID=A0A915EA26_9BILA